MAPGRGRALSTHTIACVDRDFHEWHGGVSRALAWVLLLPWDDVAALVASGRRRLEGYLLPRYERQPHVTVNYLGLSDAHAPKRIRRDLELLRSGLAGPLTLEATGWGTFPMVPYVELHSPELTAVNASLTTGAPEDHRMDYVPHVTLGHYAGTWPLAEPLSRLTDRPVAGHWEVGEVSLVSFATHDVAGPLSVVGTLDLTSGRWSGEDV